jgi:hypothetical protein
MSSFLLTNEERTSPATRYPDRTQTYRGPTVVTEDAHDVTVEKDNQLKKTVVENDTKVRKRTTTPDYIKSEVRTEYEDTGTYDEISLVNYQDDRVDKKEGFFTVGNEENSFKWIDKSGVEQTDTTETTGEIKKLETKRDVKRVTSLSDVGFTNTKTNDLKDTTKDTRSGSDTNTRTLSTTDATDESRSGNDSNTRTLSTTDATDESRSGSDSNTRTLGTTDVTIETRSGTDTSTETRATTTSNDEQRNGTDTSTETRATTTSNDEQRNGTDTSTETRATTNELTRRAGTKTNTSTRNIGLRSSTTERTAGERLNTTLSTEDIGVQVSFRVEIQNRQPIALT